jgi:hypothetical protein
VNGGSLAKLQQHKNFLLLQISPPSASTESCTALQFQIDPRQSSDDGSLALWDSTLERFGAIQLNDRFRLRFHSGMTSEAWAGWMAVKIATEAAFRSGNANPRALRKYMLADDTRFDGHKGMPLQFDQRTHLLRQTLYRRAADGRLVEIERDTTSAGMGKC